MEKVHLATKDFFQTSTTLRAVKADNRRRYIVFQCISGTCHLFIDSETGESIILNNGDIWEPKIGITSSIYMRHASDPGILSVGYESHIPIED